MEDTTPPPLDRPGELLHEAVEVARQLPRPSVVTITDPDDATAAPFVLSGAGAHVLDRSAFDDYRPAPVRRTGTARHTRLPSFIAHVNRFKDGDTAIFADDNPSTPKLTALLDYHRAGAEAAPRFGRHRSVYQFPLSPEWQAWFGKDATPMSMIQFAAFLEDHIVDVLAEHGGLSDAAGAFVKATGGTFATPTKLIEIARGLQVNENSVVKETRNLSSGEAEITFDTQHTDASGKPLKIPNLFVIAIPVFARSDVSYRLIARLRYRKKPDGLVFWYELWRPDLIFTDAFEEAVADVAKKTELPVFVGSPEA